MVQFKQEKRQNRKVGQKPSCRQPQVLTDVMKCKKLKTETKRWKSSQCLKCTDNNEFKKTKRNQSGQK